MSDDVPARPPSVLELTKTRLAVEDGELVRRNDAGGVTMRIPLDDIEAIEFRRPFNPFCGVFVALAGGFAAVGYYVSEYNLLTVFLYISAMLLGLFGLLSAREDTVVVMSRGEPIRISCPDPADEASGFVASLRGLIGGPRSRGN
ncbi:hypothetical protein [Fimbriiglobus ruber]|uniref:Uncharacterized protein n=1 Tax=Fimbriiglobus ruber TaxID=1908690 RepID=A0A225DG89_9BACT|nr:hypothetical protein [Fimbriiglobus ruber]OWK36376.1 hypothetical protein FRUB_08939 [Fimbriiglobus ruber]